MTIISRIGLLTYDHRPIAYGLFKLIVSVNQKIVNENSVKFQLRWNQSVPIPCVHYIVSGTVKNSKI